MHRRLLLSLLPGLGAAASAPARRYRVGVEDFEFFLPYASYDGRSYRGLGRDLLDAFAASRGLVFDYQPVPIKRRVSLLLSGAIDLAFPEHPDWQVDAKSGQTIAYAPMLEFVDASLVRPSQLGLGLARIRTLGSPNGFTALAYREPLRRGAIRLLESARLTQLFERLQRGEVDAVYMNLRISRHFFARQARSGLEPAVHDPELPHAQGHWHLASHHHPELVGEFQTFLQERPELLKTLQQRWDWS